MEQSGTESRVGSDRSVLKNGHSSDTVAAALTRNHLLGQDAQSSPLLHAGAGSSPEIAIRRYGKPIAYLYLVSLKRQTTYMYVATKSMMWLVHWRQKLGCVREKRPRSGCRHRHRCCSARNHMPVRCKASASAGCRSEARGSAEGEIRCSQSPQRQQWSSRRQNKLVAPAFAAYAHHVEPHPPQSVEQSP